MKKKASKRKKRRRFWHVVVTVIIALLYAALADNDAVPVILQQTTQAGSMEVHFIDVGQGDCTLVKCGDSAMLIDTGDDSQGTAVQNYLQKQGIKKLDYLILTHPDADHIGAAPVSLRSFRLPQSSYLILKKTIKHTES